MRSHQPFAASSLYSQIAAEQRDTQGALLLQSVFGTDDATQITAELEQYVSRHWDDAIADCEFFELSVSAVFGLALKQGQRIVVKVRSPDYISLETLHTLCSIQATLSQQGFPCPPVLTAPSVLTNGLVSAEALVDVGDRRDVHHPTLRRVMATNLACLVQTLQPFQDRPYLPRTAWADSALWGKPHNALFDFEQTRAGAEWIDAIAQAAKRILQNDPSPLVLGHRDWNAKNMRFMTIQQGNACVEKISVVYDWDSLGLEPETVLVGRTARIFPMNWNLPAEHQIASPDEVPAFVCEYESVRHTTFTPEDRQAIAAAVVYGMAYGARCEHALFSESRTTLRTALHQYPTYLRALEVADFL